MKERFIGYADFFKGGITSVVLAAFDADKLSDDDIETLENWESGGDDMLEEELLDSITPHFYYYAVDFNDTTPFILVNDSDPDGETWPVQCNNIYKTLIKAKSAVSRDLNNNSIEKGIIKGVL